ncbi:hypothetical protein J5N97_016326 [Dioscorea zingiberensis]|uniref:Disease resistance protein RGA3 n=1 Tax=Dioscorea zingiberensis TaxID=325984 RepID=A0A9D5CJ64_9LILI|nr:hypothetical protein J5N97_016326 [Dioscorea zingiberensis]
MAMVVDAIAGKLVERLTAAVEAKAIMILGVKEELQRLQRRMRRIGHVLKDAEKRSIQDESIKGWITELKDFMYDADDIIDRCMHEGTKILQEQEVHESSTSFTVCCGKLSPFSCVQSLRFRHAIANDIKSLNDRLEEISKDKESFKLESSKSIDANAPSEVTKHRHSSSLLESDVVGSDIRDNSRRLVELLIKENEQKCCVFSIVGMGGIGKTTLAQLIYNDPKIKNNFLVTSWNCVSKLSDDTELLKEIIRNCNGDYGKSTTIAELQLKLKDTIYDKHFFLVLDDVWDSHKWLDLLKTPVESGAAKIRVLVTTRDENVARLIGAIDNIHRVKKLTTDSGWELCKKVFTGRNLEGMESLRDIGMQIVEKCDGLPLAIKVIAGVLMTKDYSRREWETVLENDAWNGRGLPEDIHIALYISYEALPSSLKQCFLHCSLCTAANRRLQLIDLVREWIAEGYVKIEKNALMEDTAEDYYKELIKRSFLQPSTYDAADNSVCTIHDLLRRLAQFLAQDENFYGDPEEANLNSTGTKLRRLAISSTKEIVGLPQVILEQKCLRTLYLSHTSSCLDMNLIGRFTLLRALILNGEMIKHVPHNIQDLVHLRLLDLDHTQIHELPYSIGNLTNLQFLTLADCQSLHSLPKSITKLCNLRCLDLEGSSVNHVPKGIGKLENLNDLEGFVTGDGVDGDDRVQEGCDLGELQSLNNLRRITIKELERAKEGSSVFSTKQRLKLLQLSCTPQSKRENLQAYTEQETSRIEQVFDGLCPPSCLEELRINGFFGSRYPSWMSSTSVHTCLADLINLVLFDCTSCPRLPSLGQLPHLKYLKIHGATAVVSIGDEFLGSGVKQGNRKRPTAFPKLEYLIMRNMPNWEEWSLTGEDNNEKESSKLLHFPPLKQLSLDWCPKLRALPKDLDQASIKELFIKGDDSLEAVEDMPSLTEWLVITDNKNLSRVSNLPALEKLVVDNCPMLKNVEKLDSLQSLRLYDEKSNSLPEWLIDFLREKQQSTFDDDQFQLYLYITVEALEGCLRESPTWSVLEQVPRISASATLYNQNKYVKYDKATSSYDTNLHE